MQSRRTTNVERLSADFVQDSYTLYARLREAGPPRQVMMPHGIKVWMVTRYHDARALLADPRISKDGRRVNELFARHAESPDKAPASVDDELAAHMLNSDPPNHVRLRRLVGKAFTERRVKLLRPRIEEITGELLDKMAGSREAELIEDLAAPLTITVLAELLGVPPENRKVFRTWTNTLVGANHTPEEVATASAAVAKFTEDLIDAKLADPGEDMFSALVQATEEGDRLSKDELVAMVFLLVVAGHDTTLSMVGNGVYALLRHPDQLARLRADPSLLPAAVEELLRYEGSVSLATFRFTTDDIALDGVTIPAGEIVVVALGSANRDTEKFANADSLDITRGLGSHLAFGHGIHYCAGAPLGRLQVEIGIGRLLERFPDLALAVEPERLRWKTSTIMHGLVSLPVSLHG
ncbi:cytochrome P450 [Amycolatopsis sp. WAC 04197]|uniref:cytochrome P450 family protein n=1 Tax=Amycolatopsis sp. WAC 04197 TaxID=2203199 RepID=UPI000F799A48|nr:cytochrome P450 [Amycolatopsis sp. WAC 04197]RSN46091.1 cytochrome P450 [Amycolatopsis sp. WAC 04197]